MAKSLTELSEDASNAKAFVQLACLNFVDRYASAFMPPSAYAAVFLDGLLASM